MKELSPTESGKQAVEDFYAMLDNPETAYWPLGIVKVAVQNARYQGPGYDRVIALAANALRSRPAEERGWFLREFVVPSSVLSAIEDGTPWPERVEPESWGDVGGTPQDLYTYRERMLNKAANTVDSQARRILRGDTYTALSYTEKRLEARDLLDRLAGEQDIDTLDMDRYPHIVAEAPFHGGDLVEAATVILSKSALWSEISARLSQLLQAFQAIARDTASAQEIETAYANMETLAKETVETYIATNNPPPEEPEMVDDGIEDAEVVEPDPEDQEGYPVTEGIVTEEPEEEGYDPEVDGEPTAPPAEPPVDGEEEGTAPETPEEETPAP